MFEMFLHQPTTRKEIEVCLPVDVFREYIFCNWFPFCDFFPKAGEEGGFACRCLPGIDWEHACMVWRSLCLRNQMNNFSYLCSAWNFINQREKLISKLFYLFLQGNVRAMRDILKNAKPTRKCVFFLPKKTELIELNIYCIGRQYLLLKMRSAFEQNTLENRRKSLFLF